MRILSTAQMRAAEAAAAERGMSYEALMENAGRAAADEMLALRAGAPARALFLCGKGNNSGDALVTARILAEAGWQTAVAFLCGEELSPLARKNLKRLPETVARLNPDDLAEEIRAADFVVDGVFGIGFHGELPENVRRVFEAANKANAVRIALDLPSGMDADTGETGRGVFKADRTYTFGSLKPALAGEESARRCGEVTCLDIGL